MAMAPTFLSFSLRSLLTSAMVGATFGLLAAFVSIMLLFLGRTGDAISDLLFMQLFGAVIVAVPWLAYRLGGYSAVSRREPHWSQIPKWLTASLIVTLGTALSGQVALLVVTGALGETFTIACYLPGLSITAYSVIWTNSYICREALG